MEFVCNSRESSIAEVQRFFRLESSLNLHINYALEGQSVDKFQQCVHRHRPSTTNFPSESLK